MDFDTFRSDESGPVFDGADLELGEIDDNLVQSKGKQKYRADIRVYSGTLLRAVRLPGPRYSASGHLTGHKSPYFIGQLVLVGYIDGSRANPVVVAAFPHPGGNSTKENLSKNTDYDPEEVATGNGEGATKIKTVWGKDGKVRFFIPGEAQALLEVDHAANEVHFGRDGYRVSLLSGGAVVIYDTDSGQPLFKADVSAGEIDLGADADEGIPFGNELYAYMVQLDSWLQSVASWAATVTPSFGGGPPPTLPAEGDLISDKYKVLKP